MALRPRRKFAGGGSEGSHARLNLRRQPMSSTGLTLPLLLCSRGWRVVVALLYLIPPSSSSPPSFLRVLLRLALHKGRCLTGELTGLHFPTKPADLLGPEGARWLTRLLRHGGHLSADMHVSAVQAAAGTDVKDGGELARVKLRT